MSGSPQAASRDAQPVPATAGIGLRAQHHAEVVARAPAVGWFEAHSENYFAAGGRQPHFLEAVRSQYPLSLHGVGLSLGAVEELDTTHLAELKRLVDRYEPFAVSEHLCWGRHAGEHFNDLLPLPYTAEALRHMISRVGQMQEALGRRVLIENVSSYLEFQCSEMPEWEFLARLADASGCGLLVDINNIYVSARNHGFDAETYLGALPRAAVAEFHLAGHSVQRHGDRELLIDTHGAPVCQPVWELYGAAIRRFGAVPTLIEWDTDIPALDVLVAEAHRADDIARRVGGSSHDIAA